MNATSICTVCGGELSAEDRFCGICGNAASASAIGIPAADKEGLRSSSPWAHVLKRLRAATAGKFDIEREVGRGGMAVVYRAYEKRLERHVAIKVLSPGLFDNEGMVERFSQEAKTIANLRHPNITKIHEIGAVEDLHFFVMEFLDGRPLEQVLRDVGCLPIPMVRGILCHVGRALEYAHRKRVIHRDIKPGNILFDEDANAVVTDFGIAKVAVSSSHTLTGTMIGTPAYMSPEQCLSTTITGASDQYSLGVVAYEMLTGSIPFAGSTFAVMKAHAERPVPPIGPIRPDCPASLEAAVLRMLEKDPSARWPTMADAMIALGASPLSEQDPLLYSDFIRLVSHGQDPQATTLSTPVSPPLNVAVALDLLGAPEEIEVGYDLVLHAEVRNAAGTLLTKPGAQWDSSDSGVAIVDGATGRLTAVAPGTAVIGASVGTVRAEVAVVVTPERVAEVRLEPASQQLYADEQVSWSAAATSRRGTRLAREVEWTCTPSSVASISAQGVVTALAPGSAVVTAKVEEVRGSASLTVISVPVARLQMTSAPDRILVDDAFTLVAIPFDPQGKPISGRKVAWHSAAPEVASVSQSGVMRARAAGQVTIIAACEGKTASATVVIASPPPIASTAWQDDAEPSAGLPETAPVSNIVGETAPLSETVEIPDQAENVGLVEETRVEPEGADDAPARRRRSWPLAGIAAVILVLAWLGLTWYLKPWVHEGLDRPDTLPKGETDTFVRRGPVEPVSPAPDTTVPAADTGPAELTITTRHPGALAPGRTYPLRAVVRDSAGRPMVGLRVSWSSEDPAVARVDAASGRLRAVAPGSTVITAVLDSVRDTLNVTVAAPAARDSATRDTGTVVAPPQAVARVEVATAGPLQVGDSVQLVVTLWNASGSPLTGPKVSWLSSDPAIADVTSGGMVLARAAGQVTIAATSEGQSTQVRMQVVAPAVLPDTSPSPPPPPAGADIADAAAAVRGAAQNCFDALKTADADRLSKLYPPGSGAEANTRAKLLELLRRKERNFAVVTPSIVVSPQGAGGRWAGDFQVQVRWRSSFGAGTHAQWTFRAEFSRTPNGRLETCRLLGKPKI
jgi:serine/threonine protein kinase/uncharacterized protein YjdB